MRQALDECTREKHGPGAGSRSASRVSLVIGLAVLLLLFAESQVILGGILLADWEWSTFAGWFQWTGGFAGSALVPYAAKHWRKLGEEITGEGG